MNALSLRSCVKAGGDVVFRDLDGEMVLLDLRSGVYFSLDAVGARIWQLLQQRASLDRVRDVLVDEYEVSAPQCAVDLLTFVAVLHDRELVEVAVGPGA